MAKQFPYPKAVWSPAGGWWSRPSNWKANTAVVFGGLLAITYGTWMLSASKEVRHNPPNRPIPSMLWAKEYEAQRNGTQEKSDSS